MDLCEVERCDPVHRLHYLLLIRLVTLVTVDNDRVQLTSVPVSIFRALIRTF